MTHPNKWRVLWSKKHRYQWKRGSSQVAFNMVKWFIRLSEHINSCCNMSANTKRFRHRKLSAAMVRCDSYHVAKFITFGMFIHGVARWMEGALQRLLEQVTSHAAIESLTFKLEIILGPAWEFSIISAKHFVTFGWSLLKNQWQASSKGCGVTWTLFVAVKHTFNRILSFAQS